MVEPWRGDKSKHNKHKSIRWRVRIEFEIWKRRHCGWQPACFSPFQFYVCACIDRSMKYSLVRVHVGKREGEGPGSYSLSTRPKHWLSPSFHNQQGSTPSVQQMQYQDQKERMWMGRRTQLWMFSSQTIEWVRIVKVEMMMGLKSLDARCSMLKERERKGENLQ